MARGLLQVLVTAVVAFVTVVCVLTQLAQLDRAVDGVLTPRNEVTDTHAPAGP